MTLDGAKQIASIIAHTNLIRLFMSHSFDDKMIAVISSALPDSRLKELDPRFNRVSVDGERVVAFLRLVQ